MEIVNTLYALPIGLRIVVICAVAVTAHFLMKWLRLLVEFLLTPRGEGRESIVARYPKGATLTTIFISVVNFVVYFVAIGFVFREFGVNLKTYFASASVIGLAVGFGSQGLVQDVVIGLTLIFSDVLDVGDVVELVGQIGRVERIGLRFTQLSNFTGQSIFVPNRNIAQIGRFRGGFVRAYVDVQIPAGRSDEEIKAQTEAIARGVHRQFAATIPDTPEAFGIREATPGDWRYLRVKFRVWPGQISVVEVTFRQRLLASMRQQDPAYADWMITTTYRVD